MSVEREGGRPELDERQLRAILDAVGEGITAQKPDGRLIWANQAAADLCGYPSPEALLAAPPRELATRFRFCDGEGRPIPLDQLPGRRALEGECPPETLVQWAGGQGETRWSLVKANPVPGAAGKPDFVVNVFRDVTERERTHEALRASESVLAQRYAEQADAVGTLMQALLPGVLPQVDGLALAHRYLAAEGDLGGDFFDAVRLQDGRCLLTIADVSGKGPRAASLTAIARHTMRTLARRQSDVGNLYEELNEMLGQDFPEGSFCSMASVALRPARNGFRATVVVAGHPKPLLLRPTGELTTLGETGLPLAVLDRLGARESEFDLLPGDALVMCTDGCVGEGADPAAVLAPLADSAAQPAEKIAGRVMEITRLVQPGHPDDKAVLVAEMLPSLVLG